MLDKMN